MKKSLWKPDFSRMPPDTIGACFNPDGVAWAWSIIPSIAGSQKRPSDLKWRGSEYGAGYTQIGSVVTPSFAKLNDNWKRSWIDNPKVN